MKLVQRRIHELVQLEGDLWVFRYGDTFFQFQNYPFSFRTKEEAVRVAKECGWKVQPDNTLKQFKRR